MLRNPTYGMSAKSGVMNHAPVVQVKSTNNATVSLAEIRDLKQALAVVDMHPLPALFYFMRAKKYVSW